jgi:hypothetical protein
MRVGPLSPPPGGRPRHASNQHRQETVNTDIKMTQRQTRKQRARGNKEHKSPQIQTDSSARRSHRNRITSQHATPHHATTTDTPKQAKQHDPHRRNPTDQTDNSTRQSKRPKGEGQLSVTATTHAVRQDSNKHQIQTLPTVCLERAPAHMRVTVCDVTTARFDHSWYRSTPAHRM